MSGSAEIRDPSSACLRAYSDFFRHKVKILRYKEMEIDGRDA